MLNKIHEDDVIRDGTEAGTVRLTIGLYDGVRLCRVDCIDPASGNVIAYRFEDYKQLTTDEAIDKAMPHLVQLINDKGEG